MCNIRITKSFLLTGFLALVSEVAGSFASSIKGLIVADSPPTSLQSGMIDD